MTFNKEDALRNKITKRVNTIVTLIEKHGKYSHTLRSYIESCMLADIQKGKESK